jgi:heme A synthase
MVAGFGAGLACPDWPLCQGQLLPPLRLDVWLEFLHRLIAAVAGTFLLILCWRRFRSYRGGARLIPLSAAFLLAGEIIIGGLVVLLELPMRLTTLHFMIGITIFILALVMARHDGISSRPRFTYHEYAGLSFALLLLVSLQGALGAYLRHSGAGLACPDIPTCLGAWFPPTLTGPVFAHFSHRLAAVGIVITLFILLIACGLDRRLHRRRQLALYLLGIAAVEVLVGAAVVLSRLNFAMTALHLALALLLIALVSRLWQDETDQALAR